MRASLIGSIYVAIHYLKFHLMRLMERGTHILEAKYLN